MLYSEVQRHVIYINPQVVDLHLSPPPFRALQTLLTPFDYSGLPWLVSPLAELRYVYGGCWETDAIKFNERGQYRRMLDLYQSLPDYHKSQTWHKAMKAVAEGKRFKFKNYVASTEQEVERVFRERLVPLMHSMAEQGYRRDKDIDLPQFLIASDGTLIKSRIGRHRFAAARIAGVTEGFPCVINTIHREWWREHVVRPVGSKRSNFHEAMDALQARYQ